LRRLLGGGGMPFLSLSFWERMEGAVGKGVRQRMSVRTYKYSTYAGTLLLPLLKG
jgi:hypothetical protein